jgi:hypothetical protein
VVKKRKFKYLKEIPSSKTMEKSGKLEQICIELYKIRPHWDEIITRFKAHPHFDKANTFTLQEYGKYFSEIHLDLSIEKIQQRHLEYNISLRPFEDGKESRYYRFKYTAAGRVFAYKKETKKEKRKREKENKPIIQFEYDKIITVDGLPVVLEIKLVKWNLPKRVRSVDGYGTKRYREGRGVRNSLRHEVYNRRLGPVRSLFGSDVGYAMIIPEDMYLQNEPFPGPESIYNLKPLVGEFIESIYSNFKDNNGIVIPFYTDRAKFREDVVKRVLQKGLKFKIGHKDRNM